MEEILVPVLELLLQLLVEIIVYVPFDWPKPESRNREGTGLGWTVLYLVLGAGVGGLSLIMAPAALLKHEWMRIVNLIVAPLACGWMSWQIASWRTRTRHGVRPGNHFWYGGAFALGLAAVRFIWAAR